jgi:hypothetical protein
LQEAATKEKEQMVVEKIAIVWQGKFDHESKGRS